MTFWLSSKNVFEYLIAQGFCTPKEQALGKVELKYAKNFNLLLSFPEGKKLLIKQEPYNQEGKTAGEFLREWRVQAFLGQFPAAQSSMGFYLPEVLHFDADNSIIVFNYLDEHRDLADFYGKENVFPTAIAASIGAMLAAIHRTTLDRQDYQEFFSQQPETLHHNQALNLKEGLERITPEVFGEVPADGLKFFALYQRYDSLGSAIAELSEAFTPCCLMHNDLKLNNILLPNNWEQAERSSFNPPLPRRGNRIIRLRLIDWERSSWGDPAFDLGSIIASYLGIWLSSLVVSKSIELEEALRLAMTPLESLQPSIAALTSTYFAYFPEIIERRPDFLQRAMQFAGLNLINIIQSTIQYQKSFGNTGICLLQVAKSLLCRPEASIPTVFGVDQSELTRLSYAPA